MAGSRWTYGLRLKSLPSLMVTCLPHRPASSGSCVATISVTPLSARTVPTVLDVVASSCPVGSSAMTTGRLLASARAIESRWSSPPESVRAGCVATSASPSRSSQSKARLFASPRPAPSTTAPRDALSTTDRDPNALVVCRTQATIPAAPPWWRTAPDVGCRKPPRIESNVVLPDPEGPTIAICSPAWTVNAMECRTWRCPKRTVTSSASIRRAGTRTLRWTLDRARPPADPLAATRSRPARLRAWPHRRSLPAVRRPGELRGRTSRHR